MHQLISYDFLVILYNLSIRSYHVFIKNSKDLSLVALVSRSYTCRMQR